jgi:hypothetical protein
LAGETLRNAEETSAITTQAVYWKGPLKSALLDMGLGHRDLQTLPATLIFMGISQRYLMRITSDAWGRTQTHELLPTMAQKHFVKPQKTH